MFEKLDLYKSELDRLRPFEEPLLKQIKDYYKIGLTWSSNALEGNTLTESETKILIEDGLTIGGKSLREVYEVTGHSNAYDYMFQLLNKGSISEEDILNMHKLFYSSIDMQNAGVYRTQDVLITGSKYPVTKFEKISVEMKLLTQWINEERHNFHPVEFSAKLYKKFVFIHPFIDGNGRIARLLMNASLIQDEYMLAIIPPILRGEYIAFLERAHTNDSDFIKFIADRVIETEKDIMRLLHLKFPK